MLTGTVPFTGESPVDVMIKQVNEAVPPMRKVVSDAEITDEAERLILKALAKEPERRHQTMEEFHRDLQKCYGQVRFRRTVKTPTLAAQTGPTIQLTKRKKQPGAIPSQMVSGSSSSSPLGISLDDPQRITPTRPPILLTKRKVKSAGDPVTPPGGTPASATPPAPPAQPANDRRRATVTGELLTSTSLGQGRRDGPGPADAASSAPPAEVGAPRKRTTLPMGLTEPGESVGDGRDSGARDGVPEPSGDGVPWHHEQAEAPSAASRFGPSGDGSDEILVSTHTGVGARGGARRDGGGRG